MREKYSLRMATISSGCPFSDTVVKPRMSEKSTVIWRRCPPRRASVGIRDELLVDVLGYVLAEQALHLALLAPFDEVLIADAAKQRNRSRERRLRHVDPVAGSELPRGDECKPGNDRGNNARRPTTPVEAPRSGRQERERDDQRECARRATRAA